MVEAEIVRAPGSGRLLPDVRRFYGACIDAWNFMDFREYPIDFARNSGCDGRYLTIFTLVQNEHLLRKNVNSIIRIHGDIFIAKIDSQDESTFEDVSEALIADQNLAQLLKTTRWISPTGTEDEWRP